MSDEILRRWSKSEGRCCGRVSWSHRIHRMSGISCWAAINRFAESTLSPRTSAAPSRSRKLIQFRARPVEIWKIHIEIKYLRDQNRREITFKLYVVFMMPKRSLLRPSGVGRTNIIVAFSILAVKSPFDSEIACQAKFRSKYSFFAASVNVKVVETVNQYFGDIMRDQQFGKSQSGRRRGDQSAHGNIDTCQTKRWQSVNSGTQWKKVLMMD